MTVTALVVDTSAAFAILSDEPGATWLIDTLAKADRRHLSTGTALELGMVLESRYGPAATGAADRFIRDAAIERLEVTEPIAQLALEGWRRFGKGRHPASLNFGDCFTYGLAAHHDLPVLCTGEGFARTDLEVLRPER